jgi:glycerol uptake facilitator-like aquaporin
MAFTKPHSFYPYMAEFIGTFIFIAAIALSRGHPWVVGLALAVVIFMFAGYGSGHVNPAVTIFTMIDKKKSVGEGFGFIGAQVLGALLAFGLYTFFLKYGPSTPPKLPA